MNDFFQLDTAADGIAHLQFNRPERMNTMTLAFFELLREAVQRAERRGATRVLVISAHGQALQRRHGAGCLRVGRPDLG